MQEIEIDRPFIYKNILFEISYLNITCSSERFDNLSEEKFKIEDQLEQQKTAYERERQRLTGEMDKITKSHKDELKNERKRSDF